jgi:Zn ribbon nucleic-acid-binding protein
MKRKLWLWAVVGLVLLNTPGAWADGDFYVIVGGGGVGTKITSLPYEIKNPGFYYLGGNLTYSGTGNAITIYENDVTLDLMGFTLSKYGEKNTDAISMWCAHNVEIRNGTVCGFLTGVYDSCPGSSNNRVLNVRAHGNQYGISLQGYNHLVKGCNASNNSGTGIYIESGLIADCVACYNNTGIKLKGPGSVLGNCVFNNSTYNFSFGGLVTATAIMADRNSAFGLATNYYVVSQTTGVQWGINAGSP